MTAIDAMNPLLQLKAPGQGPWPDGIRRGWLIGGGFRLLLEALAQA